MSFLKYENVKQVHVELSSKCNASCPSCPRNVNGGYEIPSLQKDEISLAQFQNIFPVEFVKQLDHFTFCGNYGDPGTAKSLPDVLQYIVTHNARASITVHTNGGMRTPSFWERVASVMNVPHRKVIWSIDGLADTNHIYRRGVKWEKLLSNLKSFIASGGNAEWEYLIFGHNQHQLHEAESMSMELGCSAFVKKAAFGFVDESSGSGKQHMIVFNKDGNVEYTIPAPSDEYKNKKTILQIERNGEQTLQEYSMTKEEFEEYYYRSKPEQLRSISEGALAWLDVDAQQSTIECRSAASREIYVDAQGRVHPCCFLGIASQDADGVINHQYYHWLRRVVGIDNIDASVHSVNNIIATDGYFSEIEKTWAITTHHEGRIAQCTKHCSSEVNLSRSVYVDRGS